MKLYRSFILCISVAVLSLVIGIVMLPPFNIAPFMLDALLALVMGACMIAFILPEIMSTRGTICILNFIEFLLIALVALVLVLQQVVPFIDHGTCRMLAIAIWIHGLIGIFKLHYTRFTAEKKSSVLSLLLNILLLSFGAYLFAVPFLTDVVMAWIFSVFFFVLTFLMVALSLLYAPQKSKNH